ncbi:MAG: RDD family protein [Erysipelotrichaceae bacterium]|nr:RDD family protein [Erysipelotrichaceae bacterium]
MKNYQNVNMQNKEVLSLGKASGLRRMIAYLIDYFIATIISSIPIVLIASTLLNTKDVGIKLKVLPFSWAIIAGILGILFYFAYFFICELKIYKGQTLGKRLVRLKVVKDDGSDVDIWTLIKREVIGMMVIEGFLSGASFYIYEMIEYGTGISLQLVITYGFEIITTVSILFGIFSIRKKMFHDYIAKTHIISVSKDAQ